MGTRYRNCHRAESAGSSALVMLRALLRVRPGLVQSSEALPPEGAACDVMKATATRDKRTGGGPRPHTATRGNTTPKGGNSTGETHPPQEPCLALQLGGRLKQTRGGKPLVAVDQSVSVLLGVGFVLAHGEVGERLEVFLRLVLLVARLGVVQPHEVLEKRAAAGDEPHVETELADR